MGKESIPTKLIGLPSNLRHGCLTIIAYLNVVGNAKVCMGFPCSGGCNQYAVEGQLIETNNSPSCHQLLHARYQGNICVLCQCYKHKCNNDPSSESRPEETLPDIQEEDDPTPDIPDDNDVFTNLFPNISPLLSDLIWAQSHCSQQEAEGINARQRRWTKPLISFAMKLWITSPSAYRYLSGVMYLPCEKTLQLYKNTINKDPGVNHDMLTWLYTECERTGTPKQGGLIFDEMNIQPNVQFEPHGEGLRMFGGVDFGEQESGINNVLREEEGLNLNVATSILQFVFLALNGLRFPVAYIVNNGITAGEIASLFWHLVNTMKTYGFNISYVCMDGASINRAFLNMICREQTFLARNITALKGHIACIMDCSHVIKKLRNSLYSSGPEPYQRRYIEHPMGNILWNCFKDAYIWDKENNYLRIHRKLTPDHFNLTSSLKMRNHLAEQVLNSDMLFLMQSYQQTLPDSSCLNGVIALLDMTSQYISIYRSRNKTCTLEDPRLETLRTVLDFFTSWEVFCKERKGGDKSKKDNFITAQCFWDLKSSILGFLELCKMTIPHQPISPCLVNSDICENIFCQQRTMYSGANTNPDVYQYRYVKYFEMSTNHAIFFSYSTTAIVLSLSAWNTQSRVKAQAYYKGNNNFFNCMHS